MYLTAPQSSHFDASRFAGAPAHANHFDWELYYRYKDERDGFWLEQLQDDAEFRAEVAVHARAFEASIERTRALLAGVPRPRLLDIGLSSEKLDGVLIDTLDARLTVVDVEPASEDYLGMQWAESRFVISDCIRLAQDMEHAGQYDLVFSVGLIEHFPAKDAIVGAHRLLTAPGGIALFYAPIDTPLNRRLTAMAPELENFGYRELLTPAELGAAVSVPGLEVIAVEAVGMFATAWTRRTS